MKRDESAKVAARSWEECMLAGDFESAWEISDRVLLERAGKAYWDRPRHLQPIWNGASLVGRKVLIRCYHGLGDTMQFIRYVPKVVAIAHEVAVWVQPTLIPLLRTMKTNVAWLTLHDGTPAYDFEVDIELMELPYYFRTQIESIPQDGPYVFAQPRWRAKRSSTLQVGIAWAAGTWNPARSLSAEQLGALTAVSHLTWHALQRGAALAEWNENWGPVSGSDRVEEVAERVTALDLVISVDSFPAHLSGALGVQTWVLLPKPPDWRWLADGDRSPWYPSMRLFRQRENGDWSSVLAEVRAALFERIGQNARLAQPPSSGRV